MSDSYHTILSERMQLIGFISEGGMICLEQTTIEGEHVIFLNPEDVGTVRDALDNLLQEFQNE